MDADFATIKLTTNVVTSLIATSNYLLHYPLYEAASGFEPEYGALQAPA